MSERYTLRQLENLPTITGAHSADLKIEDYDNTAPGTDGTRVWLERAAGSDTPCVTVEYLRNGRWLADGDPYVPDFPTLPERLEDDGVRIVSATFVEYVNDWAGPGTRNARWNVKLGWKGSKKTITQLFTNSQANGTEPPKVAEFFNCMLMDAGCWINAEGDFAAYADDFGLDLDDRNAELQARKTFKACERIAGRLREVFGDGKVDDYLYRTEGY